MSATSEKLYSREILALAVNLAGFPHDRAMPLHGSARSSSCGSALDMTITPAGDGSIAALGIAAQACAIGQASAAIFAEAAVGRSRHEIAAAFVEIEQWLRKSGPLPNWPGFSALAAARDFPARHGAITLAWRAALDALP